MTALKQRMMADMKLHGLAPGTQRVYLKAVYRLAAHYMLAPDRLTHAIFAPNQASRITSFFPHSYSWTFKPRRPIK